MNNSERIERMRERISAALTPDHLDIEDESHLHAGHVGAKEGKGHFRVTIVSRAFADTPPLKRHKLVFEAVGDLMETDIHALSIDARPPSN